MSEEKLVVAPVENLNFFTPKQPIRAGTANDPQPDGKPIPTLFKPYKLRGLTLQNRIGVSPMVQYSADNGKITMWHEQHYNSFAARGPGLITVEASAISPEARASPEDAGIWNDELARAWIPVTTFAHSQGENIGIQLNHSGRKGATSALLFRKHRGLKEDEKGWPDKLFAPSAISFNPETHAVPKELTKAQIKEIVKQFGEAAKRSVEIANFDYIEIHAAHGYLINEFLSLFSNKRTDEYGGSFENRARFFIEVVEEIRSVIPDSMPLLVRLSATENTPNEPLGWTIEDSKKLADLLIPRGVDAFDMSSGGNNAKQERRGNAEGFQLQLAAELKEHVGDRATVIAVGGLKTAEFANKLLEDGKADLVFVARAFLRNPSLVWQWADELNLKVQQSLQYMRALL